MYQFSLTATVISTGQCQNGKLQKNASTNILNICVSGAWKTLCPYLWGQTQTTVACRQLAIAQGKSLLRESIIIIAFSFSTKDINMYLFIGAVPTVEAKAFPSISESFEYLFYCTGQEEEIADCSLRRISTNCSNNLVAGVKCTTGIQMIVCTISATLACINMAIIKNKELIRPFLF